MKGYEGLIGSIFFAFSARNHCRFQFTTKPPMPAQIGFENQIALRGGPFGKGLALPVFKFGQHQAVVIESGATWIVRLVHELVSKHPLFLVEGRLASYNEFLGPIVSVAPPVSPEQPSLSNQHPDVAAGYIVYEPPVDVANNKNFKNDIKQALDACENHLRGAPTAGENIAVVARYRMLIQKFNNDIKQALDDVQSFDFAGSSSDACSATPKKRKRKTKMVMRPISLRGHNLVVARHRHATYVEASMGTMESLLGVLASYAGDFAATLIR